MGAFPGDELARRRSLAALLFRLERPVTPEELEQLRVEVSGWFRRHPDQERLRRVFVELISQAYRALGVKVPVSYKLLEMKMKSNLATIGETWRRQALAEGLAEGRAQGLSQGLTEGLSQGLTRGLSRGLSRGLTRGLTQGKAEALVCLLVARFGTLTPSLRARIRRARLATLERWFKRAIAAPDLRSVFKSQR